MSEFAKQVLPVALESEMRESYLAYAMSVIVGRALPDVRDGPETGTQAGAVRHECVVERLSTSRTKNLPVSWVM
jgi:hypothetical protein